MTVIGFHCSHEQITPAQLLLDVQRAERAGFTAAMSSDHFSPWSTRQGESGFAWSFLGAALVYLLFEPVIDHFNLLHHLTRAGDGGAAGVFFTHPGESITPAHAFVDEIVLTGFLVLGIFAITEQFNTLAPAANTGALMIGLLVATIGACAGYLEAWPINPARDFGPRLFCFFSGWGAQAFPAPQNYWWVPIAGPLLGGIAGGGLYQLAVRPFLPPRP